MKKIVCIPGFEPQQNTQLIEAAKKVNAELVFSSDKKEIIAANAIIGEPDVEDICANPDLEWVQMTWAGTDKYTMNPGFPKKVRLSNMSGAFGVAMAEYAIGAILFMYRNFDFYKRMQDISTWKDAGMDDGLYGKKVLFLGTGDIGSKTAIRLKAFGTYNIGLKRTLNGEINGFDELDTISNLEKHLGEADIVICSVPNKPETRNLFNKERLLLMKKNATLLNMGRGTLINLDDLDEVLNMNHLGNVILDVTNPEPLPKNHPLWKNPRVFITPHISGKSVGHCPNTQQFIVDECCKNIESYFSNNYLLHEIKDMDFEYERV